jgi:hypothetical protein
MDGISTAGKGGVACVTARARSAGKRALAAALAAGFGCAMASSVVTTPAQAETSAHAGTSAGAAISGRAAADSAKPRAFFGLGPASATKIDGRPYFYWAGTPGSYLKDHVAVVNYGTTTVNLYVFASNAVSTAHGGTAFLARGASHGGLASWITIDGKHAPLALRLAPKKKVFLPISVVFPHNATPGDHEGAIIASLTSTIESKNHAKVHLVQQVASRIIARVSSGRLQPRLSVSGLKVSYRNPLSPQSTGSTTLEFTIVNTGNEILGGKVSVYVSGLLGSTEERQDAVSVPAMIPGGTDAAKVTVPGVYPELLMHAKVDIAPIAVTGEYDQGLTTYTRQADYWAWPRIPLLILIFLILLGVGLWYRRRRRHNKVAAARQDPVPAASTAGGMS